MKTECGPRFRSAVRAPEGCRTHEGDGPTAPARSTRGRGPDCSRRRVCGRLCIPPMPAMQAGWRTPSGRHGTAPAADGPLRAVRAAPQGPHLFGQGRRLVGSCGRGQGRTVVVCMADSQVTMCHGRLGFAAGSVAEHGARIRGGRKRRLPVVFVTDSGSGSVSRCPRPHPFGLSCGAGGQRSSPWVRSRRSARSSH